MDNENWEPGSLELLLPKVKILSHCDVGAVALHMEVCLCTDINVRRGL